jgi:four helix bundle protein
LQTRNEFVISKQLLRSGTSIGANIEEATAGQSRKDFASKMAISSKEARETYYWLRLLRDSNMVGELDFSKLVNDCEEIIRILTAIVKAVQSH